MILVEGKKHNVIKRDGRIEPFSWEKLNKVLDWAITFNTNISNPEPFRNMIIENLKLRIYDKIHIQRLFDEVIEVTANLVSTLYPIYDTIARNLYLLKIHKEFWGMKRLEYPNYNEVIEKALKYKVYNKEIISTFSEEELKELGDYIKPEKDLLFTFSGLIVFIDKYSAKYSKKKHLELPQHTFMRVAIQLHYKDKNRIERIKEKYDALANHHLAIATPFYLNALKDIFNPISCVLVQTADDSESIMETARSMAIFSKNGSGLGVDISKIRCVGSLIGVEGASSGVIPFVKIFESTITAFNQRGSRPGSAAIYYPWWHYETPEIIMLRDAGGTDSERARKLKYNMKHNKLFLDFVQRKNLILNDDDEIIIKNNGEELKIKYGEIKKYVDDEGYVEIKVKKDDKFDFEKAKVV